MKYGDALGTGNISWSPDGKSFVFSSGPYLMKVLPGPVAKPEIIHEAVGGISSISW